MHVGLVVYGDLEQTSGGYRYDRKLVAALEARGDDVNIISLPREDAGSTAAGVDDPDPEIRDRLNRPFDVLVQDELCYPSLLDHNPHLDAPDRIVALVHLLRSANPAGTTEDVREDDQEQERERERNREREHERRYLESVDAAICTSAFTRDRTTEIADLPTTVVPPAGRREDAARSADVVENRARTDPFRIAFVGNLVPRKNLETLVAALDGASRRNDWRLTVVGDLDADPAYARAVRNRVTDARLGDRVTFAGEVTDTELESIYERSHVLAVPARYEGFGMVYLEAMEYGVVPIASTVGGAGEFVADGRNGFLVGPDDSERLATLLAALESDRDRLATLACRALATASAHPTWEETMADLRSFLQWVLDADDEVCGTSTNR